MVQHKFKKGDIVNAEQWAVGHSRDSSFSIHQQQVYFGGPAYLIIGTTSGSYFTPVVERALKLACKASYGEV